MYNDRHGHRQDREGESTGWHSPFTRFLIESLTIRIARKCRVINTKWISNRQKREFFERISCPAIERERKSPVDTVLRLPYERNYTESVQLGSKDSVGASPLFCWDKESKAGPVDAHGLGKDSRSGRKGRALRRR